MIAFVRQKHILSILYTYMNRKGDDITNVDVTVR
jgi:hypothetical protein